MQWISVKDELPPLDKKILIGSFQGKDQKFRWVFTEVSRPYERNEKYNPSWYEFYNEKERDPIQLTEDHYWLEIEELK